MMAIRRTLMIMAVMALLFMIAFSPAPTSAHEPLDWSRPEPVAEDLATSWFPEIAVDPSGTFWMVWSGNLTGENANQTGAVNGAVMISKLTPEGWTPTVDLYVMFGGIASRPMLAIDDTYIHLIFRTGTEGQGEKHFYMRAPLASDPTDVHVWSDPIAIAGGQSYWSDIKILPDGTLLVSYNERISVTTGDIAEQQTVLYTRRSLDQGTTWEPPVRVSPPGERVARNTLAVSPTDGTVTLVWDVGYDNMTGEGEPVGIYSAVSTDGGESWSDVQRIDAPETGAESQAAAGTVVQSMVASNGPLTMLIYRSTEEDLLFYRTSADGGRTWQPEVPIVGAVPRPYSSDHQFDKYGLATDSAGNFIFTYIGADEDAPDGLAAMSAIFDEASGWSDLSLIGAPEGYPEYARPAVALGNQVKVVYFVRDEQFAETGHYVLWVASTETDAPASAPQPIQPDPDPTEESSVAAATPPEVLLAELPTPPPPTDPIEVSAEPARPQSVIESPIIRSLAATAAVLLGVLLLIGISRMVRQIRI